MVLQIGTKIFYYILYVSIIASILAIIILGFRKAFDRKISPTWKFAMWILLFISLCIPFRITIQAKNTHTFFISHWIDQLQAMLGRIVYGNVAYILLGIWLLGVVSLTIYYLVNEIVMRKRIGKKIIKEERILRIFEKAKKQMGVTKKILLVEQSYKKVPCIYGVFRPKILLTKEVLSKDEETLTYIFMHELAHYQRKDLELNQGLVILSILHWFNPILWICFYQIRQDMELKADEKVLQKLQPKEDIQYAKALVQMLPVSQEEKRTVRVLSVTDNKKNMERRIKMIKLSDKFKEYKALIGITTLLITLCIGTFIFTQIKPSENAEEKYNYVQFFETPDRILYKEKGQDNYYVYTSNQQDYVDILNKLINGIDSISEGIKLSKEEIQAIEREENYIELDYDTISKNYLIAFEKENYQVIKRNDNGGEVVKANLRNAEELKQLMEEKIQNKEHCYHMQDSKEYQVNNEIAKTTFDMQKSDFREYEAGIYGKKMKNVEELNSFIQEMNINLSEEISSDMFTKTDIIVMVSRYEIERIDTRVGGMTYYFTGKPKESSYLVNIFAASKAINTNCIYRDLTNTQEETTITNSSVGRKNQPPTVHNQETVDKTVRITKEQASDIADEEAKKEKYQYQGWESDFTSKNMFYEGNTPVIVAELIYTFDPDTVYYWEEEWAYKDSNGNYLYQGQPVWYVRLGDKNDPLTGLYIYVDATNGQVVGAGQASD